MAIEPALPEKFILYFKFDSIRLMPASEKILATVFDRAAAGQSDETGKTVFLIGLLLAFLASTLVMHDAEPLRDLDRMSYNLMLNLFERKPANPRVLVIDIDELSLTRYGQWP